MGIEIGRLEKPLKIYPKGHEFKNVASCCLQVVANTRPDLFFRELETGDMHKIAVGDPEDGSNTIATYWIDVDFNGRATVSRDELNQNGVFSEDPFYLDENHPEHPLFIEASDETILLQGIIRYRDSNSTWYS